MVEMEIHASFVEKHFYTLFDNFILNILTGGPYEKRMPKLEF